MSHGKREVATGLHTLLVCRVLTGRQGLNIWSDRGPLEGYDSGTDGSGQWINVSFKDFEVGGFPLCSVLALIASQLYAEYSITFAKVPKPEEPVYSPTSPRYSPT